jgi:uncharacterized membrane protein
VKTDLTTWLENLLRAVLLLMSLLHFLGWGFSGETGLLGNSMLVVVGATLAVAVIPDSALRETSPRLLFAAIDLAGVAAMAIWTWHTYLNSWSVPGWQPLALGGVTGLGLLAGLARLRCSTQFHESKEA